MSRNDVIIVANDKRTRPHWFYVFHLRCADKDWDRVAYRRIQNKRYRFGTAKRWKALLSAHNLQRKRDTEYGVRELDLFTKDEPHTPPVNLE